MALKKARKRKAGAVAEQKLRKRALAAAQLAPAEERRGGSVPARHSQRPPSAPSLVPADEGFVDGSVTLDGARIRMPGQIVPPDGDEEGMRFSAALIVVLTIALGYTAFVAWLIFLQPA